MCWLLVLYLRDLEEAQQVGDLHGGDGGRGAHHAGDHLAHRARVARELRVVDVADRTCNHITTVDQIIYTRAQVDKALAIVMVSDWNMKAIDILTT